MTAPVRLLVLSDLHLELGSFEPPDASLYDVVVLAGDIAVGVKAVHSARRDPTFGGKPVVKCRATRVLWQHTRPMLEQLSVVTQTNVHVLDRDE